MSEESRARAARLADEPLRTAGPRPGLVSGTVRSIRDIYAHRELLGLLVRRELKARYKDSILGFFWTLARPLAMLLVYYVAIGRFLGAEQSVRNPGGVPSFAIFIFTGLTAWQLYSDIISTSTASIVQNSGLIKKVYVPREVFPLAAIGASLFNFLFQLFILLAATAVIGQFPPLGERWLFFLLAMATMLTMATALALLLSAVNVYLRDVQYLVEILLMIMMWASPIVYSWSLVENEIGGTIWSDIYLANPMTQVVMGFQRAFWVAGDSQVWPENLGTRMFITLGISLVLLWVFQRVFAKLQSNFAQEL